ncbi:GNAT family N-acetyltransferase [Microbacterium sp. ASV81]|uniref:GNAT family N-acetyltransferase n=1 Tax=Microbacterium capsulatum TaxID=3041921 RepID=A0ABU0XJZ2_9MICO|nr:GNAT family N-acetyltransferase [Microbacterium sp. ASV81]MDQ4215446.1 GNAT family N-acetyltransferase [Microbacterium sp. ASV81]
MTLIDAREIAADPLSTARLGEAGLDYRVIDMADDLAAAAFARAGERGFLNPDPAPEAVAEIREAFAARRNIGVFDPASTGLKGVPVATVNSFVTPLTVPGGTLDMWAVSAVTVNGTHRRRGIARNLLEGELRSAVAAGAAIAGLTVTEATLYGRYGFGPAVPVSTFTVDARRAGWAAVPSPGRLETIEREQLAEALAELHERTRVARAGQIPGWNRRWRQLAGLAAADERGRNVRGVRYLDEDGVMQGVMAYTLEPLTGAFGADLVVRHVIGTTPEGMRAVWGFAVNHDLVRTVTAALRPADDPLPLLVADQRAVQNVVHDHGWLRILDVPAALTARTYRAPLDIVIAVTDPYGYASGSWRLRIGQDGTAAVAEDAGVPDVEMGVAALSTLYLGGVRATALRVAGLLRTASKEAAVEIDDAFRSITAPALTIWY